jgi:hypothetical protein
MWRIGSLVDSLGAFTVILSPGLRQHCRLVRRLITETHPDMIRPFWLKNWLGRSQSVCIRCQFRRWIF